MKGLIQIILLYFFIGFCNDVTAQSPKILCVKGDTIFWEIPTLSPISYDVFVSSNALGPFSLLSTVVDPNQNFYHHPNPGGVDRYYYFIPNFGTGIPALPSDTLDNKIPEISPISAATVDANQVQINWQASASPEVIGYIIYRTTDIGTIPIDTIYDDTEYIDLDAAPNNSSEVYFILALDPCNNTSIFDLPHRTIFLNATSNDICEQKVNLSWNLYQNWTNGIERQEVWASTDGSPSTIVATLTPTDSTYTFLNTNDGENYCFFIRAVENVTGAISNSNITCITADVVQPMRNLILKNASVTGDNQVLLFWDWDVNADIISSDILRSEDNASYTSIVSEMPPLPLNASENFTDDLVNPASAKQYYQIQTLDECDEIAQSNYVSTIFTTGEALENRINKINWTAYDVPESVINDYEIFSVVGNTTSSIGTVDGGVTSFEHEINPLNNEESTTCYFVIANATITLTDGNSEEVNSRSNVTCIEQFATIYMPNAFAPRGRNQSFKPVVVLGESAQFEMHIFDRWGKKLFTTNDLDKGWDGKINGSEPKVGVYTYLVKLTQSNGQIIEKQGSLFLLK